VALHVVPEPAERPGELPQLLRPERLHVRLPPDPSRGGPEHLLSDGAHPRLLLGHARHGHLLPPRRGLHRAALVAVGGIVGEAGAGAVLVAGGERDVEAEDVIDGGVAKRGRLAGGGEDDGVASTPQRRESSEVFLRNPDLRLEKVTMRRAQSLMRAISVGFCPCLFFLPVPRGGATIAAAFSCFLFLVTYRRSLSTSLALPE